MVEHCREFERRPRHCRPRRPAFDDAANGDGNLDSPGRPETATWFAYIHLLSSQGTSTSVGTRQCFSTPRIYIVADKARRA